MGPFAVIPIPLQLLDIYGIPETKRTIRVSVLFVLATYRMISKLEVYNSKRFYARLFR